MSGWRPMTTDTEDRFGMRPDDLMDLFLRIYEGNARPADLPVAGAWVTHKLMAGADMSGWLQKLEQAEQRFATLQTPDGGRDGT